MPGVCKVNTNMSQWYNHAIYNRYWQQYWMTKDWIYYCKKSQVAANQKAFCKMWQVSQDHHLSLCKHTTCHRKGASSQHSHRHGKEHECHSGTLHAHPKWCGRHASSPNEAFKKSLKRKAVKSPVMETLSGSSELEDSESEFDFVFSEEWLQHMNETIKFREERDKRKEAVKDKDFDCNENKAPGPPSKLVKYMKDFKMQQMYGDSAAKIRGMEVAMQLSYDRHFDAKRPHVWPVLPLKM